LIEGSFHSHQVPLPNAKTDKEELQALQHWLSSYNPHELFHVKSQSSDHEGNGHPTDEVLSIIPENNKIGQRKEAYSAFRALQVPVWIDKGVEKGSQVSCMKVVGSFLKEIIKEYVEILVIQLSCSNNTYLVLFYRLGTPSLSAFSLLMN
jgi:xylulose-5-phosphate/fructose-6-phosphate phosphoketolase